MVKLGRLVTLLLCATMLTMSSASAQFRGDDEDLRTQLRHVLGELQLLRAEIKEFKERVAALEARDSGKDEPRPQRTPTRDPVTQQELLMQIEGIRAGAAGEVVAAWVEALRLEAA